MNSLAQNLLGARNPERAGLRNREAHSDLGNRPEWLFVIKRLGPSVALSLAVAGLVLLGLTILLSAGHGKTISMFGQGNGADPAYYLGKQAIWLVIGLIACGITAMLPLEKMRAFTWPLAALVAGLLILVLIPGIGVRSNGAQRWLDLGLMRMQVSDFAKIGLIWTLAHYMAIHQRNLHQFFKGFVIPCALIGCVFMLIILEPDFGTAFLTGLVGATILFLAGVRLRYLIPAALVSCAFFAKAIMSDPIRLRRVMAFIDVDANKADSAYQLWQGMLAFGAGGLRGVGLGNGRQQMAFLPEAHTDFIFPVIGEELGYFFTTGVVLAFLSIFGLVVFQVRRAPNMFQFLLASGAILMITVQALINICVATGCLPTKGLALPFISYGGSNLVVMFILVGILLNCFRLWGRFPLERPMDL